MNAEVLSLLARLDVKAELVDIRGKREVALFEGDYLVVRDFQGLDFVLNCFPDEFHLFDIHISHMMTFPAEARERVENYFWHTEGLDLPNPYTYTMDDGLTMWQYAGLSKNQHYFAGDSYLNNAEIDVLRFDMNLVISNLDEHSAVLVKKVISRFAHRIISAVAMFTI